MFAFAIAVVSRCAVSALCPTDADLKAALYAQVDQDIADYIADEQRRNPKEYVVAHPVPIRSIRDVHCGSPTPSEPQSIHCSFTFKTGNSVTFETAKLTQRDSEWVILDELTVTRSTDKAKH